MSHMGNTVMLFVLDQHKMYLEKHFKLATIHYLLRFDCGSPTFTFPSSANKYKNIFYIFGALEVTVLCSGQWAITTGGHVFVLKLSTITSNSMYCTHFMHQQKEQILQNLQQKFNDTVTKEYYSWNDTKRNALETWPNCPYIKCKMICIAAKFLASYILISPWIKSSAQLT